MKFICSHDEHVRCHRLLRVLGFVQSISADAGGFDIFRDIEALEDWKGTLVVHCRCKEPTVEQQTWFKLAWRESKEPYDNVNFVVEEDQSEESIIKVS
jgi:hypothetical protein